MNVTKGGDTDSHAGTVSAVTWEGITIGCNTVYMDLFTVAHAVGYVDMRDEGNTGIRQAAISLRGASENGVQLGHEARMVAKPVLGLGRVKLGKIVRCSEEAGREEPHKIADRRGHEVGVQHRVEVAAHSSIVAI